MSRGNICSLIAGHCEVLSRIPEFSAYAWVSRLTPVTCSLPRMLRRPQNACNKQHILRRRRSKRVQPRSKQSKNNVSRSNIDTFAPLCANEVLC